VTTSICVPESDDVTVVFTRLGARFGAMTPLLLQVMRPLTLRIFAQDKVILEDQARNLKAAPGAPMASTVADVPCLWVHELHDRRTTNDSGASRRRAREVRYRL
jgi:hypothetical protein